MKPPSADDRFVKVRAYMTDKHFGYDHWRAGQFSTPEGSQPAILVICTSGEQRDGFLKVLQTLDAEADKLRRAGAQEG